MRLVRCFLVFIAFAFKSSPSSPLCNAFSSPFPSNHQSNTRRTVPAEFHHDKNEGERLLDRRSFGIRATEVCVATTTGLLTVLPSDAAQAYQEEKEDKEKIRKGFQRLTYLLDHWVQETTVCGKSDDNPYTGTKGCERTPLIVMDYLGYKSINDPLFKADKTLKRLAVLVPNEDGPEYLDAMEKWTEAAEEASGMAYVSSWGEANPGGGKDRVELFIERAKKNVVDARDSLATAIRILGI
ncbi:hypothetical protein ACA910_002820 [Epithemia clementina (nom. ined.)]